MQVFDVQLEAGGLFVGSLHIVLILGPLVGACGSVGERLESIFYF